MTGVESLTSFTPSPPTPGAKQEFIRGERNIFARSDFPPLLAHTIFLLTPGGRGGAWGTQEIYINPHIGQDMLLYTVINRKVGNVITFATVQGPAKNGTSETTVQILFC